VKFAVVVLGFVQWKLVGMGKNISSRVCGGGD